MIFSINTSTTQFSVALLNEYGVLSAENIISSEKKSFDGFMPAVFSLFEYSGIGTKDLTAVVVAIGPGSFTGLRVGMSVAKGIAHSLDVPIIGVSSLESLASQIPYTHNYCLCPMISSRKGEVFAALFKWESESTLVRTIEDRSIKLGDLPSIIDRETPTLFIGNDIDSQGNILKEMSESKAFLAPSHLWNLRASAVGALGLKRFIEKDFDDIRDLVPAYLRPPDIRPDPYQVKSFSSD